MHRAAWRRLLALLVGVWFPLYATEPAALLACPMHGAPVAAAEQHHAAATSPDDSHDAHRSHDGGAHHCTCPGDCCATAVALSAPTFGADWMPHLQAVLRVALRPATSHAPRAAEHALPFATAPPLV